MPDFIMALVESLDYLEWAWLISGLWFAWELKKYIGGEDENS